jgi:DNA-binding CsgD family transcriptional regulator/GAF domain-containing protein
MLQDTDLPTMVFDFVAEVARSASMAEFERRYLDGIGAFIPGAAAGLYLLNPYTRGADAVAARGVSDFFLSRYEEAGRHQDPVLAAALVRLDAVHSGQLMDVARWREQPVYEEVFGLHRMAALLEAPLVLDGRALGTLNFGRSGDQEPFTEDERRLAAVIARMLALAVEALRRGAGVRRDRDNVVAALDLCAEALMITDLASAERRVNAAGRRLLDRVADGGFCLEDLLLEPPGPGQAVRRDVPVTLDDGGAGRLRLRSVRSDLDAAIAVTFLSLVADDASVRPCFADGRLTPREQAVAQLAAAGLRDMEIAAQLVLSPHTVKQYLKTVYGKLGVRSRTELASVAHAPAP